MCWLVKTASTAKWQNGGWTSPRLKTAGGVAHGVVAKSPNEQVRATIHAKKEDGPVISYVGMELKVRGRLRKEKIRPGGELSKIGQ